MWFNFSLVIISSEIIINNVTENNNKTVFLLLKLCVLNTWFDNCTSVKVVNSLQLGLIG